jgi:hypothetical protein
MILGIPNRFGKFSFIGKRRVVYTLIFSFVRMMLAAMYMFLQMFGDI